MHVLVLDEGCYLFYGHKLATYIYIYIYSERERERDLSDKTFFKMLLQVSKYT